MTAYTILVMTPTRLSTASTTCKHRQTLVCQRVSSGCLVKTAISMLKFFFFQAEDGIRDWSVTGVQTCALPISLHGLLGLFGPYQTQTRPFRVLISTSSLSDMRISWYPSIRKAADRRSF